MKNTQIDSLPVIPLRDMAPQPGTTLPMFVGRERSKNAVKAAAARKTPIILVSQKTIGVESPKPEDLYGVGVLGELNQVLEHPDGTIRIVVTSKYRGYLRDVSADDKHISASFEKIEAGTGSGDIKKAAREVSKSFGSYCKYREDDMLAESRRLLGRLSELQTQIQALRVAKEALQKLDDPIMLADMVPGYVNTQVQPEKLGDPETIKMLDARIRAKQAILSEPDPVKRLQMLRRFIEGEMGK